MTKQIEFLHKDYLPFYENVGTSCLKIMSFLTIQIAQATTIIISTKKSKKKEEDGGKHLKKGYDKSKGVK